MRNKWHLFFESYVSPTNIFYFTRAKGWCLDWVQDSCVAVHFFQSSEDDFPPSSFQWHRSKVQLQFYYNPKDNLLFFSKKTWEIFCYLKTSRIHSCLSKWVFSCNSWWLGYFFFHLHTLLLLALKKIFSGVCNKARLLTPAFDERKLTIY